MFLLMKFNVYCLLNRQKHLLLALYKQSCWQCFLTFLPTICTKFANLSFEPGCFSTSFKAAQIKPLLKKPNMDESHPVSYRPVSNLDTVGNILETLILTRLRDQIVTSSNFKVMQSAYRAMHSTEMATLQLTSDLRWAAGNQKTTIVITLDLAATFHTISHSRLLSRLATGFGICDNVVGWIKSYLTGWTQSVSSEIHRRRLLSVCNVFLRGQF